MNLMHESIMGIISAAGIDIYDLASKVGEEREILTYRNDLSDMPVSLAFKVSDVLNVDIGSLLNGDFNRQTAITQLMGDQQAVLEKYNNYNGTKLKTIKSFLEFAKDIYGDNYASYLRQRFQLPQELLDQAPDHKVSGQMLMDMFSELHSGGVDQEMFFGVGSLGAKNYEDTIKPALSAPELTARQLYEEMIYHIDKSVEQNLSYKILKANDDKMVFSATARPQLQEALKTNIFGSVEHSYNIIGWFAETLTYISHYRASVKKLFCSYSGDPECIYEIDYSCANRNGNEQTKALRIVQ